MAIAFISHSSVRSGTEEDQKSLDSVRAELSQRLREFNWDVRVDDLLPPGCDWRSTLRHWIADSDAAVVLVNRDSPKSAWLKYEVDILLWRRATGSRVTIVPVLLNGMTPRELRRSELSQLADLQVIEQRDPDTGCEDVVSRVLKRLGDMGERADTSAMRSLTAKFEHCLDRVEQPYPLQEMANALEAGQAPCSTMDERRRFIAHQFLRVVPTQRVPPTIKKVSHYLDKERRDKLAILTLPTWIDPVAVRHLLPDGGQVVATLGNARPDTAEAHVDRASCFSEDYWVKVVPLVAGEGQGQEHLGLCVDAVRELNNSQDETEVPADGDVLFLVLDPQGTELPDVAPLVRTLTARFDWLNIIVLTGGADPADLGAQTCRTLHIEVPAGAEEGVDRTVQALRRLFSRRPGYGKDLDS